MNLPQYQLALEDAARRFSNAVDKARDEYTEAIASAHSQFFNPEAEIKPMERLPRDRE